MRGLREKLRFLGLIRPRDLAVWLALSCASVIVLSPLSYPIASEGISSTLHAINITASVLTFGIPFSLGSALVWNKAYARQQMVHLDNTLPVLSIEYLKRYVLVVTITTLFMAAVSLIAFTAAGASPEHLPGVLVAAFIVSALVCPLMFLIAIAADNTRMSTGFGSTAFIILAFTMGYTQFSVMHDVGSLYAPYHFYRFLATFLTGYEFDNSSIMQYYMQINVEPIALLGPALMWAVISILAAVGSLVLLRTDIDFWKHDMTDWGSAERVRKDSAYAASALTDDNMFRQRAAAVRRRKQLIATLLILFFISTMFFNYATLVAQDNPDPQMVLYQSPFGGESVVIGGWRFGTVEVTPSSSLKADHWVLEATVNDWGEYIGTEGLTLRFGLASVTESEFLAMNETEREEVYPSLNRQITPEDPSTGSGSMMLQETGLLLWAVRFTENSGNITSYIISVTIVLYLKSS